MPRPETETVVEAALAAIDAHGRARAPLRIADLGTGSGALLLALLSELPAAIGVGTDRSLAALEVARDNARRLRPRARARFVACDYGAALAGGFDLVVSNPPYIATGEIATLAPEVRDFDPRPALDGGADGLDAYRAIAADARAAARARRRHWCSNWASARPPWWRGLFDGAGLVVGRAGARRSGRYSARPDGAPQAMNAAHCGRAETRKKPLGLSAETD